MENNSEAGIQPVLAALDFSPDSDAAMLWACEFAKCVSAPLIALHVIHDLPHAPGFYQKKFPDESRPMADIAAEMLDEFFIDFEARHPNACKLEGLKKRLVRGLPDSRIIEVAIAENARIIVMGSKGLTGIDSVLLGSVAENVVRHAPMPVTVVKCDDTREAS